jgi:hypothetical protein
VVSTQRSLFEPDLPSGFRYRAELIGTDYEERLLDEIARVELAPFVMRGVEARRRVAFFGASYGRADAPPIPDFLLDLRERVASWSGVGSEAFGMALSNEYRPGSPVAPRRAAVRRCGTRSPSARAETRATWNSLPARVVSMRRHAEVSKASRWSLARDRFAI